MTILAENPTDQRTAISLRDYQHDGINAIDAAEVRNVRRQLVTMPTGSGKTVVFSALAHRRGGRTLILAHRDELIEQAVTKYLMVDPGADIGVVKAERDEYDPRVVIASVQTLARPNRLRRLTPDFDLIIVDEAHHAPADSYVRILTYLGCFEERGPLTVGFTATADRGDGVGLSGVFQEIVFDLSMLDLIERGYLSDIRAIQVRLAVDYNRLHLRRGDFDEGESAKAFMDADGPTEVVGAFQRHAPERKGVVFVPTVTVAHKVAEAFRNTGVPSAALDGSTPTEERRRVLRDLKSGAVRVVPICQILTEGFDEPSIDCVVIARPTRSRPLFQQMIGRGTRRHPGKTDLLVIDCVGATTRNDLVTTASLFGLSAAALTGATVTQAIAAQPPPPLPAAKPAGSLISTPVDLFRRRSVHWVPASGGRFVLPTGQGNLVLRPRDAEAWDVLQLGLDGGTTVLATSLSLGYAQGLAEDRARILGAAPLVQRGAPWRSTPASEKQCWKLRYLGIKPSPGITRGEASDLISAAMVAEAS